MKPSIPSVQDDKTGVLGPIKENIETITGRRGTKITQLSGLMSLESACAKINEILSLLQDTESGKISDPAVIPPATEITAATITAGELVAGNLVGMIAFFGASSSIPGWLKTDGATYNTADYPALAAFLGAVGETFVVPEIRGEFLRVLDDGRGVDAGRTIGSAQADDFKSHVHMQNAGVTQTGGGTVAAGAGIGLGDVNTDATGGTETRPRNVAYPAYIKT